MAGPSGPRRGDLRTDIGGYEQAGYAVGQEG